MKQGSSSDDEEIQLERILPNVGEGFQVNHPVNMCNDQFDISDAKDDTTVEEAHCNIIFDLTVLAEIVTYKSSVVGVSLSESSILGFSMVFFSIFNTGILLRRIILSIDNSILLKCRSCL